MDISIATEQLSSEDDAKREEAANWFAIHPGEAKAATVPLLRNCGDPNEDVRQWCEAALEEVVPNAEELSELQKLCFSNIELTAYWAITLIGRLGSGAGIATATLARVLDSSTAATSVRQRAAWALGQVSKHDRAAIEALERAAASDDVRLVRLARRALEG